VTAAFAGGAPPLAEKGAKAPKGVRIFRMEGPDAMRFSLFTLLTAVGALATILAALTVWLVLQEPVIVADAVSSGQLQPLFATLAREFHGWMVALVRML
jgi:hypothetical protein